MAIFETSAGIDGITGKLDKRSRLTMRQKQWKYPDGRVFGYGPKEVYSQDKRNFKRHPRKGAEKAQHSRWTEACQEASRITKDPDHPRYEEMIRRHAAQLNGTADPAIGKQICQFGNFVRAILVRELGNGRTP